MRRKLCTLDKYIRSKKIIITFFIHLYINWTSRDATLQSKAWKFVKWHFITVCIICAFYIYIQYINNLVQNIYQAYIRQWVRIFIAQSMTWHKDIHKRYKAIKCIIFMSHQKIMRLIYWFRSTTFFLLRKKSNLTLRTL